MEYYSIPLLKHSNDGVEQLCHSTLFYFIPLLTTNSKRDSLEEHGERVNNAINENSLEIDDSIYER